MNKFVASVGIVALGASAFQVANAQSLLKNPDGSKPWSVAATLRGFYDDNISCVSDEVNTGGADLDSWGWEVSPSLNYRYGNEQTAITLGYLFSYKYYQNKPYNSVDHDDMSHTFNIGAGHAFSERLRLGITDSFVIGQEPDLLRAGDTFSTFQRVDGDNIRNYGDLTVDYDLSRLFAVQAAYANGYYNYDDDGPGSYSALLDRMENSIRLDGKWKATPQTTGVLGYTFLATDYFADELISPYYTSEVRNSYAHYAYVGADHNFTQDLQGSLRGGARYNDYYNDETADSDVSPYARGSLRYLYGPQSYVEGGFGYDRTPTDIAYGGTLRPSDLTLDADTFTVFATWNHEITSKLIGVLRGQFQNSEYNGGSLDGEAEQIYLLGAELQYKINQYLSAHAGYTYDRLDSDIPGRTFDRNRVYFGLTASY